MSVTAYLTIEQSFLHCLWVTFESLQDKIENQDSSKYQVFERINPVLLIYGLIQKDDGILIFSFLNHFFDKITNSAIQCLHALHKEGKTCSRKNSQEGRWFNDFHFF